MLVIIVHLLCDVWQLSGACLAWCNVWKLTSASSPIPNLCLPCKHFIQIYLWSSSSPFTHLNQWVKVSKGGFHLLGRVKQFLLLKSCCYFSSSLLHTALSALWPLNVHSQLTWLSDDLFGYLTTSHQIRDCMSSTTSSTHFPHHQCSVCSGISWSSFFGLWSQSHNLWVGCDDF